MRTRWSSLALSCIFLALGTTSPGVAQARLVKSLWGPAELPAGNVRCPTQAARCSAFPTYRELGVDVFQFQLHWDEVAPTRPSNPRDPEDPAYHWGAVDQIVNEAARYEIGLAALAERSPPWANGGRAPIWAPANPNDFADFVYAASQRYPSIHRWMIWGEPARAENFQPMRRGQHKGPRLYAVILDKAYAALKKARRQNIVIGGMTLNGGTIFPSDFIKWMKLPNGRPPRMDLWGHNPFDARFPHLADKPVGDFRGFNDIDTLHAEIAADYRRGHRKVPRLWLSEWSIVSDHPLPLFSGFYVSRRGQAVRIKAAYRIASRTPYVAGLGWFTLLDEAQLGESVAGWGLLTEDGATKPSFDAFKQARRAAPFTDRGAVCRVALFFDLPRASARGFTL
jgi:hypothetical protein